MSTSSERRAKIKEALKTALAKVKEAVTKLIKTRFLVKAEERYAKALKSIQEKFIDKVDDLIDDLVKEDNATKKATLFVVLKFCVETMEAVGESLTIASAKVREEVDFSEYEANEEVVATIAKIENSVGTIEDDTECGEDGCEIA